MKLNNIQINELFDLAKETESRAAFTADAVAVLEDQTGEKTDPKTVEELAKIWDAVNLPFRDLLKKIGLTQTECSRSFFIPLRTVQNWCGTGKEYRECAVYTRLMISELSGYIKIR